MNGRIFRMDIPAHQAVQELLPWYASEQLAPDETRRVQEHLQTCAQCRQDLEWERDMRAEATASDAMSDGVDMESALARLMPTLGAQEHAAPVMATTTPATPEAATTAPAAAPTTAAQSVPAAAPVAAGTSQRVSWWRAAAANQPSWLRWTVAAQWVLIVGLGALLLRPDTDPAPYRVLGSAVSSGANLVVIFRPNTSERELRHILQAQGARVVDGPTVTDAYLLHVPPASRERALAALHAEPAVQLAEALDGGTPP
ncbi:zf-HC2 domain-containing protein [Duganella sp. BJB488]|uniref:zf-HC2 domain-containing protein n=1 Tax=unclassified Duganella TaxID=2636909 RepID=UPI000E34B702|nr:MULTISPECIES: zf-HC2 domain-containing protein [unclassified Duganella]RFP10359.1 zf-HC2 domain-containing protein [Duganella sp. BJB489]RFP18049.1 zf-HC2 domain-containing protein [Duganella sp. BJB488]RFP37804.1 zf-HC2 domain-containing protein [Duganella sp. BJB480]